MAAANAPAFFSLFVIINLASRRDEPRRRGGIRGCLPTIARRDMRRHLGMPPYVPLPAPGRGVTKRRRGAAGRQEARPHPCREGVERRGRGRAAPACRQEPLSGAVAPALPSPYGRGEPRQRGGIPCLHRPAQKTAERSGDRSLRDFVSPCREASPDASALTEKNATR